MKIIKVKTDSKNYDIKVGHDLLGSTPLKKLVSQKDILLIEISSTRLMNITVENKINNTNHV